MDEDVEMSDNSDSYHETVQQLKRERFGSENQDSQHKNKHGEGASSRSNYNNNGDEENSETEDDLGLNQERITRSAAIRSVASPLSSAEVSQEFGLFGPIASNTHKSVTRLSHAFGFGSDASFETWLDGDGFKPFYDELQEALRNFSGSVDTTKKSRQGPRLMAVQKAITAGESYGKQRYSRRSGPITTDFSELDFYALCVFEIVDFNTVNCNGAFFSKKVPVPDMQVRVWHAMRRANLENTTRRNREEQSTAEASNSVDSHNGEAGEVAEAEVPKEV